MLWGLEDIIEALSVRLPETEPHIVKSQTGKLVQKKIPNNPVKNRVEANSNGHRKYCKRFVFLVKMFLFLLLLSDRLNYYLLVQLDESESSNYLFQIKNSRVKTMKPPGFHINDPFDPPVRWKCNPRRVSRVHATDLQITVIRVKVCPLSGKTLYRGSRCGTGFGRASSCWKTSIVLSCKTVRRLKALGAASQVPKFLEQGHDSKRERTSNFAYISLLNPVWNGICARSSSSQDLFTVQCWNWLLAYNFMQRSFKLRNFLLTKILLKAAILELDSNSELLAVHKGPLGAAPCARAVAFERERERVPIICINSEPLGLRSCSGSIAAPRPKALPACSGDLSSHLNSAALRSACLQASVRRRALGRSPPMPSPESAPS